jgi:glycosyltransferase involved in cell wall biosynthesis
MMFHAEEKRESCRARARMFDWEAITDSIEEYYQSISGDSPAGQ